MFQTFDAPTRPDAGPPRLAALRAEMARVGVNGFLVPRADAHQGEYVADCDARLAWLTGFTGSAGFCAVLPDRAGLFVDGRYRVQARAQTDALAFDIVPWPDTRLAAWLREAASDDAVIAFDPWLHTVTEIEGLRKDLAGSGITLLEQANLVDAVWPDRPAPPVAAARAQPDALAGRAASAKRADLAAALSEAGHDAAVLTQPDSIAWLLNIRGGDIPRIPIVQAFALLHADGRVDLFTDPAKLNGLAAHLGPEVTVQPAAAFSPALRAQTGTVRLDRDSAPLAVQMDLAQGTATPVAGRDPCLLPKACKTAAELAGADAAHLRDGAAMVEFLCWLDRRTANLPDETLTEIDCVRALEGFRAATGCLRDIAFDTIAGTGPHGAIVHYRVTEGTNRAVAPGDLLLIDSGGQYDDGTTDITRTIAVGDVGSEARAAFTRVLKGMIAVSRARFPDGVAGRDLDALARFPLWLAGQDYDHGTGHGVGSFLSVHEGPQRISRAGAEPLRPGMIVSNEPGYYREDAFGIRIENLVAVEPAPALPGGDPARKMLCLRTLTHVPIDRRALDVGTLDSAETAWLDAYHAETRRRLEGLVSPAARDWLVAATAPLGTGPTRAAPT
ncbi:X-Pro aminopeptidase [Meridianimarinicoccus roseus]|uniref:X-Pro aminopeptidase n=1 Tax=Meridianimarinicoccus roseus TaxID=2072018 RepID=A0A2V2LD77_9RHOB|nr:aminopeptidase P family protein [Meridianimarinicoccus roseus]PWR01741.1 X-Pro aminopeptidase [Meridianimarinicoccus roseus]